MRREDGDRRGKNRNGGLVIAGGAVTDRRGARHVTLVVGAGIVIGPGLGVAPLEIGIPASGHGQQGQHDGAVQNVRALAAAAIDGRHVRELIFRMSVFILDASAK